MKDKSKTALFTPNKSAFIGLFSLWPIALETISETSTSNEKSAIGKLNEAMASIKADDTERTTWPPILGFSNTLVVRSQNN